MDPFFFQRFLFESAMSVFNFYAALNPLVPPPLPRRRKSVGPAQIVYFDELKEKRARRDHKREEVRKLLEVATAVGIYGEEKARALILGESSQNRDDDRDGNGRGRGERRSERQG